MNNGEIERGAESWASEREREKPGEGQKPAECHVKCIPVEIDGDVVGENESAAKLDREEERETKGDGEQRG